MTKFLNISVDNTLGGNSPSDELVASQKAIKEYVDNKSVDIDNSTITKNGNDELQAVATINSNTATGATNPVYDWVGTLEEYNTQNVGVQHPDWLCYITDDVSGGASVYTKTEVDNNFVGKGHEVIEFQAPTAGNNYTWYRKYADGWVEQGGTTSLPDTSGAVLATLPIQMTDTKYSVTACAVVNDGTWISTWIHRYSTTQIRIDMFNASGARSKGTTTWEVRGMAA